MTIAVGEKVPEGIFPYVPYAPELDDLVRGATPSLSRSSSTHTDRRASLLVEPVRTTAESTLTTISPHSLSLYLLHRQRMGWKEGRAVCRSRRIHRGQLISFDHLFSDSLDVPDSPPAM